ncbi:MAG: lysine-2,3-aminomutase-like protein [Xanthobacteraceae bacterium]|nr:lysine-2,3-aminomutase-like protein [Xanthobacteraceae bacterium]
MNAAPKTLRQLSDLDAAGLAPAERRAALEKVAAQYAVAITPAMTGLIDRADPNDPIARQFVPDVAELTTKAEERADPIGDDAHSPCAGIVHRYPDRVLLKLTHVCAVYCRFCFRREMVGPGTEPLTAKQLDAAIDYIASRPDIWEVILTGGDPLVLSPRRIRNVMARLAAIDHVKIVRIHTRVPVAEPARITAEMARALKVKGKATYVVLHANHARELTDAAREACARMIDAGIPMLSQSVLLKGVNDDPQALGALMRALVENRIKPYYLHHGDLAPGTSHLRTSIERGQELMRALRGRLSGLCHAEYVLDIPGGFGKSPIGPSYLTRDAAGRVQVEDFNGGAHCYPPTT